MGLSLNKCDMSCINSLNSFPISHSRQDQVELLNDARLAFIICGLDVLFDVLFHPREKILEGGPATTIPNSSTFSIRCISEQSSEAVGSVSSHVSTGKYKGKDSLAPRWHAWDVFHLALVCVNGQCTLTCGHFSDAFSPDTHIQNQRAAQSSYMAKAKIN